jgi:hypothetical protein
MLRENKNAVIHGRAPAAYESDASRVNSSATVGQNLVVSNATLWTQIRFAMRQIRVPKGFCI